MLTTEALEHGVRSDQKITIKTPDRTFTYFTSCSSVSSIDFERVNNHWKIISMESLIKVQTESHFCMCKGSIGVQFRPKNIPQIVLLVLRNFISLLPIF